MTEKNMETCYQETKQHGSRLFPFNIYPCTIPLDFPAVLLHWHRDMELVFVKKGKGKLQLGIEFYERRYLCDTSGNSSCHPQRKRMRHGV